MELGQLLVLAIVQALTEFLPVSSSAHLALAGLFLGWAYQGVFVDLMLHAGTLLAVLLYYRRDFAGFVGGGARLAAGGRAGPAPAPARPDPAREPAGRAARAAAAAGRGEPPPSAAHRLQPRRLRRPALARGPASARGRARGPDRAGRAAGGQRRRRSPCSRASRARASASPSRSGSATAARESARLAFLLAAPITAAACLGGALRAMASPPELRWLPLALGVLVAALAGMAAIRLLVGVLERLGALPFTLYRLLLASAVLVVHARG
ncbi:MAG: undecaprenyl-diphosphate phosphatase [Xanthomonadales bacterium]|nr:undecaprenyl-diphosphate phosphatase [Xanthomonadales bacterium]